MPDIPDNRLLLITGPAGAGRTTAIHILEDMGYEAIDNLPLGLLPRLLSGGPLTRPLAIGIDTRTRGFAARALLKLLDNPAGQKPELVFMDCSEETLLRRFSETRRRHPVAPDETPIVGIRREKDILAGLPEVADYLIDTSDLSPHDLKAEMQQLFHTGKAESLALSVQSFSYKRGTPRGVDMIIDCRFLRNPHWEPELRAADGTDPGVAEYIRADPLFEPFFDQLCGMCRLLLPAYRKEGKSYFSVGLGCSGGKHRSVFVTEHLANLLEAEGWQVSIRHRELERRASGGTKSEGNETG